MIELDVCIDRSGEVVVHHDNYLKTTGQLLSVRFVVSLVWLGACMRTHMPRPRHPAYLIHLTDHPHTPIHATTHPHTRR